MLVTDFDLAQGSLKSENQVKKANLWYQALYNFLFFFHLERVDLYNDNSRIWYQSSWSQITFMGGLDNFQANQALAMTDVGDFGGQIFLMDCNLIDLSVSLSYIDEDRSAQRCCFIFKTTKEREWTKSYWTFIDWDH